MLAADDHVEVFYHGAVHSPDDEAVDGCREKDGDKESDASSGGSVTDVSGGVFQRIDEDGDGGEGREGGDDGAEHSHAMGGCETADAEDGADAREDTDGGHDRDDRA